MKSISIIIPTFNEEGNIRDLVTRLTRALKERGFAHEIIFIDDYSTDNTVREIANLKDSYSVRFYFKEGKKGKAFSLLEGFEKARFEIIGMIDADLQYAPESVPDMAEKLIRDRADIVIGKRQIRDTSFFRKLTSDSFQYLFGKILHKLDYDIQSGLKVFRKEILDRCRLNPTPWTFDLEFLTQAKNAGYKIEQVSILFHERVHGKSKVSLLPTSYEIAKNALRVKLKKHQPVPFVYKMQLKDGKGFYYKGEKFVTHTQLDTEESAFTTFFIKHKQIGFVILLTFITGLIINWHITLVITFAVITFFYFSDLLFNLYLLYKSLTTKELSFTGDDIRKLNSELLPVYTIFCPLYKEWKIIPQFIQAMRDLNYPKDKLQVLLLLEEDDTRTYEELRKHTLPAYFQVIIVPDSVPKTKPKALNYGLIYTRGEYAVIYDAEDIPEKDQLKKAFLAFNKSDEKTICIQAKLNFYNPQQNLLTKLFTLEYTLWFGLILPGLQSLNAPIPLGGTSNHFRTKNLYELHGWDPFNVTEDADLGIRLAKEGYQTAMMDSTTYEEANSNLVNWLMQRSRWIKGYIQTYLVHMRNPSKSITHKNLSHFAAFQFIVGGKIIALLINPLMWVITFSYFAFRPILGTFIESFFPPMILYMGITSLVIGNFMYLYYYMIASTAKAKFSLVKYAFLVPMYWLMMSAAAGLAVINLIVKPHYWAKTKHGLHLADEMETPDDKAPVSNWEERKRYIQLI